MKRFHAHIYFESENLELGLALAERAHSVKLFESVMCHEQPVGPHPTAMIEVQFGEPSYTSVLEWIEANRGSFSVLIHQDTGDDFKDHSEGIQWIGKKLLLDFAFFELIQARPD